MDKGALPPDAPVTGKAMRPSTQTERRLGKKKRTPMNIIRMWVRYALALSFGCGCVLSPIQADAADASPPLPAIIQAGFDSWAKGGGSDGAIYVWQKGGLMEADRKPAESTEYLRRVNQAGGNYRSCELLKTDGIGKSSHVVYLSINFE